MMKAKNMAETCQTCMNMCRFACPVSEAGKNEIYSPFSKMTSLLVSDSFAADSEDLMYYCTNCGLCTEHCLHGIEVELFLAEARNLKREKNTISSQLANSFSR